MGVKHRWTIYFFLIVYPKETFGIETFCVANPVSVGDNASVSCHFSEDLSIAPQRDIHVYLYKDPDYETVPKLVLFYSWINGTSHIQLAQGYDYQSKLSDHLEISIYNVTEEHAGMYKCNLSPDAKHKSQPCSLHVNRDGDIERESETTSHIIAIICSVIAIVLLVIPSLILFAYWKRRICKSKGSTSSNDNAVKKGQNAFLNNPENHHFGNGGEMQKTKHDDESSRFISIPTSDPIIRYHTKHQKEKVYISNIHVKDRPCVL